VSGNNTPITINVEDRDLDTSDAPDKVNVKMQAASGANTTVALTETGAHTGAFTSTIKLSTDDAATTSPTLFKVKAGDRITALYVDDENPSGKPENREYNIRANIAENAKITFLRQIVERPEIPKGATARMIASLPLPIIMWDESTTLVPGYVYNVILSDPDIVPTKPGEMYTSIALRPTNGSSVVVPLRAVTDSETLEMTFQGEFFARLGDSNSPTRAFFSQTGSVVDIEEDKARGLWSLSAVNLQGKDQVLANYVEPLASDGARNVARSIPLRVAANGKLSALNVQGNELELLKPGVTFELQVDDADGDLTPKRDTLKAALSSSGGDKMSVELSETDIHSGIFSALIKTAPGTSVPTNAVLEVPFAGKVTVSYHDEETIAGTAADRTAALSTRDLADAEGLVLTKVYDDPKFELETLIRLGESLYAVGGAELATSKTEDDKPRTNAKLQEAESILQQIIQRFPTSDYVVESLYLTGKIRREEHKFDEAEKLFTRVIEEYPDSDFVPESHFQLVLLYYSLKDIDKATEAAMRLVYGYPKNPLVADAFLRIAEYYYTNKEYVTSAYIYKRLIERFPDNPKIELVSYRMATAYYRAGVAGDEAALNLALRYYMEFAESYKDHELADDALYWAANTASKQGNIRRAFTLLTRQLVTYPTGDMKAYATRLRDKIREDNPGIEPEQE
jgi:TolA-binding protein